MAYTKPQVVAQNSVAGSYTAGCPTNVRHNGGCISCEITR